jgi:hypothetical protein
VAKSLEIYINGSRELMDSRKADVIDDPLNFLLGRCRDIVD